MELEKQFAHEILKRIICFMRGRCTVEDGRMAAAIRRSMITDNGLVAIWAA